MADTRKTIKEIVDAAVAGDFDIPEFQRGFVWQPVKVKDLIDSLWREYPIGTFLCWEPPNNYDQPKTAHADATRRLWIVDGQQRATAACLILGKKPYWWPDMITWNKERNRFDVLVNIEAPINDLEFNLPNPIRRNQPEWVSVRNIINAPDSTVLAFQFMKRLGISETDMRSFRDIHAKLVSIGQIASQRHVFIVIVDKEPEDVAEIFARLNLAGTKVKEADVALALFAGRQPGWVREQFDPFLQEIENIGYQLDPAVLVRTLISSARSSSRLKEVPKDFWSDREVTSETWGETQEAVRATLRHLREKGILNSRLLVSTNALIPLFILYARFKSKGYHFSESFAWFLHANWEGRYSGSAITVVEQDIRVIKGASSFGEALDTLLKSVEGHRRVCPEELLATYRQDKFLRLLLYLSVFDKRAEGWLPESRMRIGFTEKTELRDEFDPEWHHFFPRAVLSKLAIAEDDISSLANIAVLASKANQQISKLSPQEYIKKFDIPTRCLEQQFLPLDTQLWNPNKYSDFQTARAEMLALGMNKFLDSLVNRDQ